MAFASSSDVAALCRNLVSGASDFSTSTSPTQAQVNAWLSSGCAVITLRLNGMGYGALSSGTAAYELAGQINALYAAWLAERSRINARTTADERTRADMLRKDFDDNLKILIGADLSRAGVSQTGVAYAGGISADDKDTQEADSDRVNPRFVRGMFANPEALDAADFLGEYDEQAR